jgi:hypothetical protein
MRVDIVRLKTPGQHTQEPIIEPSSDYRRERRTRGCDVYMGCADEYLGNGLTLPTDADTRAPARKLYCEKFPLNAPQSRLAAVQLALLAEP